MKHFLKLLKQVPKELRLQSVIALLFFCVSAGLLTTVSFTLIHGFVFAFLFTLLPFFICAPVAFTKQYIFKEKPYSALRDILILVPALSLVCSMHTIVYFTGKISSLTVTELIYYSLPFAIAIGIFWCASLALSDYLKKRICKLLHV